jgi:predicted RNase H-like HicB family nuclease
MLVEDEVTMTFKVDLERETDGRWIAEIEDLPGVLAYGATANEARAKAQALALRVLADRLEHEEAGPDLLTISFAAA